MSLDQSFKILYLKHFSTDWLTYLLIYLLTCLHYGATFEPLCVPILSSYPALHHVKCSILHMYSHYRLSAGSYFSGLDYWNEILTGLDKFLILQILWLPSRSLYSIYIGIMKVREFWPQIITPKPGINTALRNDNNHLGSTSVIIMLLLCHSFRLLIPLKNPCTACLTYLLYLLMLSDKHNSRVRDSISSLINVTLSQDMPFHQPQLLQCLHHGATFVPLCAPILSSQPRKVMICGWHVMAVLQNI